MMWNLPLALEGSYKTSTTHVETHVANHSEATDCGQKCNMEDKLGEHGKGVHKEGGSFAFPDCKKTFTKYPNIRKHIKHSHEEEMFSCTVCNFSFTGRYQFKTHLANHSEETDFMWEDCGQKCNMEDKLGEHGKRMHNNPRKKERPIVGQGLPGEQDLIGQPPNRHLEVLIQWTIPGRESPVEDIGPGMPGGQDLKEQPPDRHLEVLIEWNIPSRESPVEDIDQGIPGGWGPERAAH